MALTFEQSWFSFLNSCSQRQLRSLSLVIQAPFSLLPPLESLPIQTSSTPRLVHFLITECPESLPWDGRWRSVDFGACRTSLLKAQKHSFGKTGSSQGLLGHGDNATIMVLNLAVTDMVSWKTCRQRNQWTSGPVQYPGPQSCRMWLLIGMRWWREGNRGQVVQKTQYCHVMMNI